MFQGYRCHLLSVDLKRVKRYNMFSCKGRILMDIIKVFGTNLKKYRKEKGISQERLAELCGLHRTYISDLECCARNVSLKNVQKIADALEINSYKLLIDERMI